MDKEFSLIPNENISEESELETKQVGSHHRIVLTDRRIFYHVREKPGFLYYLLGILIPVPFLFVYYHKTKRKNTSGFMDLLDVESIKQRRRPLKRIFSFWIVLLIILAGLYSISLWTPWFSNIPVLSKVQDLVRGIVGEQILYQWLGLALLVWVITFLVSLPLVFSSKWLLEIRTTNDVVEIDAGKLPQERINNFVWQVFLFKESLRKHPVEPA